MPRLREFCAFALSLCLLATPVSGTSTAALGTVTAAQGARVGTAAVSAGATVFGGDRLSTEAAGILQIRTGAARFLLSATSTAEFGEAQGTPGATLLSGTALFSTANAKAFLLRAAKAEIRPQSDAPTVAQVSVVGSKELLVRSTRGALAITYEGETQIVPEASAYRVILDPDSAAAPEPAQGPRGAGAKGPGGPPLRAGRSRFIMIAIILTAVATWIAVDEALESPDRP